MQPNLSLSRNWALFWVVAMGCSNPTTLSPELINLSGNASLPDCGFTLGSEALVPPSDPCDSSVPIVRGPITLEPQPGNPATDQGTILIPEPGFVCVRSDSDKIASASALLNGENLFRPNDFHGQTQTLQKIAAVNPTEASINWEVRSTPQGSLTYQVRYLPSATTPRDSIVGTNGKLTLFDLGDGPDPFSPADQNGVRDTITVSITAEVNPAGISTQSQITHLVRAQFQIASGDSCGEVITIEAQAPITSATPITSDGKYHFFLSAVWDGKDQNGVFVADGKYFYQATTTLDRITPSGNIQKQDEATSAILSFTVDNTPPQIIITKPDFDINSVQDPLLEISGRVVDTSIVSEILLDIVSETSTQNLLLPLVSTQFQTEITLDEGGDPVSENNSLVFSATDEAGNSSTRTRDIELFRRFVLNQVGVSFFSSISESQAISAIQSFGGTIVGRSPLVNGYWIEFPSTETIESSIAHFKGLSNVRGSGANLIFQGEAAVIPNDPILAFWSGFASNPEAAYDDIDIYNAWSVSVGSRNVKVAVIDSGISLNHPDLIGTDPCQGNIFVNVGEDLNGNCILDPADINGLDDDSNGFKDDVTGLDFGVSGFNLVFDKLFPGSTVGTPDANLGVLDSDATDSHGHGTAVAGIIGAIGDNGEGTAGVNWQVSIVPLRVSDRNTLAFSLDGVINAINYAKVIDVDIINMSFGLLCERITPPDDCKDEMFKLAIEEIPDTILIAASACNGNERFVGQNLDGGKEHIPSSFNFRNIYFSDTKVR